MNNFLLHIKKDILVYIGVLLLFFVGVSAGLCYCSRTECTFYADAAFNLTEFIPAMFSLLLQRMLLWAILLAAGQTVVTTPLGFLVPAVKGIITGMSLSDAPFLICVAVFTDGVIMMFLYGFLNDLNICLARSRLLGYKGRAIVNEASSRLRLFLGAAAALFLYCFVCALIIILLNRV